MSYQKTDLVPRSVWTARILGWRLKMCLLSVSVSFSVSLLAVSLIRPASRIVRATKEGKKKVKKVEIKLKRGMYHQQTLIAYFLSYWGLFFVVLFFFYRFGSRQPFPGPDLFPFWAGGPRRWPMIPSRAIIANLTRPYYYRYADLAMQKVAEGNRLLFIK